MFLIYIHAFGRCFYLMHSKYTFDCILQDTMFFAHLIVLHFFISLHILLLFLLFLPYVCPCVMLLIQFVFLLFCTVHWADLIRLHFTSSYALYNYYVTNKTLTLTLTLISSCFPWELGTCPGNLALQAQCSTLKVEKVRNYFLLSDYFVFLRNLNLWKGTNI